jgi:hypothetical protein
MSGRNHVPPPDAAPAPNTAPGRLFFDKASVDQDTSEDYHLPPPTSAAVDLTKPNLTRQMCADTLFAQYVAAGQDEATARANADARALLMVP